MLIAPFCASSCGPIFQYRLIYPLKFILSKNFAIIWCYSEVMTSPFYIVKLESFTLKVCQLELKKGCQPKLLFERFGAISNIVRRPCILSYLCCKEKASDVRVSNIVVNKTVGSKSFPPRYPVISTGIQMDQIKHVHNRFDNS